MPLKKEKFNAKARAGGIAKTQAIRDARKHGRRLPQPDAPKSKKQKRIDKYVETKLRNDEKVKLMGMLGDRPKVHGMESTKVMKRPKSQMQKVTYETFSGFDDSNLSDSDSSSSERSHSEINRDIETAPASKSTAGNAFSFGFPVERSEIVTKKRKRSGNLKYNWRTRLEQQRNGVQSKDASSQTSSLYDSSNSDMESERILAKVEPDTGFLDSINASMPELGQIQASVDDDTARSNFIPRDRSRTPEVGHTGDLPSIQLTPVLITRKEDIELARGELPAYACEQEIVEAIKANSTVIISGATGSGKTTQVPQFLYEAGVHHIGITQPRRVAAVSMAKRIAVELGDHGHKVAYQIRFDSTVKSETAIKLMTDGVLLREVALDFMLTRYDVIIIDEAHERSINTDILIGVLSRVIRLRKATDKPLRLVIMSATLRVQDFAENQKLFQKPPPILSIDPRQYAVTNHFSRRTEMSDYVQEAFSKICKIHEKLPPGGILVFLTGQQEINHCMGLLREHFGRNYTADVVTSDIKVAVKAIEQDIELDDQDATPQRQTIIDSNIDEGDSDSDISDIEETEADRKIPLADRVQKYVRVLPLYSLLPTTEQLKVFQPVPRNTRKIVIATNVAETSLTIPDIRYVVDCGRAKARRYDGKIQSFEIDWISKASSDQRSGRAGRTGPGHAYRLYSSAVYDSSFPLFSEAEILNTPIDGIVLQMKSMNIHTIANFPFPTPPDRQALAEAELTLRYIGALNPDGHITETGRQMSLFPVAPRFAKMLIVGSQGDILQYIIAIVAVLSIGDPFIQQEFMHDEIDIQNSEARNKKKQAYFRSIAKFSKLSPSSDIIRALMAVGSFDHASDASAFCEEHFLRYKAMQEIQKLRKQITKTMRELTSVDIASELKLLPPSSAQIELIHNVIGAAYVDQICIRADLLSISFRKTHLLGTQYVPLHHTATTADEELAYIHPACHSIIRALAHAPPEYLIYSNMSRSSGNSGKVRLQVLCPVKAADIATFAKGSSALQYSKPIIDQARLIQQISSTIRKVPVIPRLSVPGSGRPAWDLPAILVNQEFEAGRWRTVD